MNRLQSCFRCLRSSPSVTPWQRCLLRYISTGQSPAEHDSTATEQPPGAAELRASHGPHEAEDGQTTLTRRVLTGTVDPPRARGQRLFNLRTEIQSSKRPYKAFIDNGWLSIRSQNLLENPDGTPPKSLSLNKEFMRDHCSCEKCVHPITKQRLIETFSDIPSDITHRSVTEDADGFKVTWTDGHESYYTKDWLQRTFPTQKAAFRLGYMRPRLWRGCGRGVVSGWEDPPKVGYHAVMTSDAALRRWLKLIRIFGFCYVENTPVNPEDTKRLLERIAYIRVTHYGGFWDFTSDLSKGDTAYTNLGIGPHTDNTYFSDPAGLQLFHLLSHTDGEGGESTLVDGFQAAAQLQSLENGSKAYHILSNTRIATHASGNRDSSIQPWQAFPTLVHDSSVDELVQIRWNTTDRASICVGPHKLDDWYWAARLWSNILKENQYQTQLKPGTALIFDNWRVLHGRTAFTGKRRMCGGYINRDDFISRYKVLTYGKNEVLRQVMSI